MKMKKTLVSLLATTCMIFPACGENGSEGSSEGKKPPVEPQNPYATAVNLFENGNYFLMDAESFWQCVSLTISPGMKKEMCSDEAFVKHGENSLKVTIVNGGTGWASPRENASLGISCSGSYFQKTNFSDCDYFSVDVYNAQDFPVTFWYQVTAQWGCGFAQTIQPGWNTVVLEGWKCNYSYRSNSTEADVDPEQSYLGEINSFTFSFPSYESAGKQVYYLDNFIAHKKA